MVAQRAAGGADASRNHPVLEHGKVKDDSLAPRVLAEGGAIGFLEHAGGVLLLGLVLLELGQHLHQVPDDRPLEASHSGSFVRPS
jgi:hypothetical protein